MLSQHIPRGQCQYTPQRPTGLPCIHGRTTLHQQLSANQSCFRNPQCPRLHLRGCAEDETHHQANLTHLCQEARSTRYWYRQLAYVRRRERHESHHRHQYLHHQMAQPHLDDYVSHISAQSLRHRQMRQFLHCPQMNSQQREHQ